MKIKSLLRVSVLIALSVVGFFGVFSVPMDDSQTWLLDIIISKGIGLAAFYAVSRIYPKWAKVDPWLKAYEKSCNKALDAPNPMKLD